MSIIPGDLNPKTLTVPGATTSSPASTPSRTTLAKLLVEGDVSPVAQNNLALIDAAFGVPASFSAAPASYSAAGVAGNVAFDSAALCSLYPSSRKYLISRMKSRSSCE